MAGVGKFFGTQCETIEKTELDMLKNILLFALRIAICNIIGSVIYYAISVFEIPKEFQHQTLTQMNILMTGFILFVFPGLYFVISISTLNLLCMYIKINDTASYIFSIILSGVIYGFLDRVIFVPGEGNPWIMSPMLAGEIASSAVMAAPYGILLYLSEKLFSAKSLRKM